MIHRLFVSIDFIDLGFPRVLSRANRNEAAAVENKRNQEERKSRGLNVVEVEKGDLSTKKKKNLNSSLLFCTIHPRATPSAVAYLPLLPAYERASTRLIENRTANAHREAR